MVSALAGIGVLLAIMFVGVCAAACVRTHGPSTARRLRDLAVAKVASGKFKRADVPVQLRQ
jgi:hypothetical protein